MESKNTNASEPALEIKLAAKKPNMDDFNDEDLFDDMEEDPEIEALMNSNMFKPQQ